MSTLIAVTLQACGKTKSLKRIPPNSLKISGEEDSSQAKQEDQLHRLRSFSDAVMQAGGAEGLHALIGKLQEGLAAAESLPVYTTQVSTSSSHLRFGGGSLAGTAPLIDVLLSVSL